MGNNKDPSSPAREKSVNLNFPPSRHPITSSQKGSYDGHEESWRWPDVVGCEGLVLLPSNLLPRVFCPPQLGVHNKKEQQMNISHWHSVNVEPRVGGWRMWGIRKSFRLFTMEIFIRVSSWKFFLLPSLGGFVYDLLAPDLLLGLMNQRLLFQRPHKVRRIYFVNYNLPSTRKWRFGRSIREIDKSSWKGMKLMSLSDLLGEIKTTSFSNKNNSIELWHLWNFHETQNLFLLNPPTPPNPPL